MPKTNWEDWRRELEAIPTRFGKFYEDLETSFKKNFPTEMFGSGPRIEITEDPANLYVDAEVPGLTSDDVKLTIADNILVLKGERKRAWDASMRNTLHSERPRGAFERKIPLNQNVDEAGISANFHDGLLSITIPKAPQDPPQEREIKIG